MNQEKYNPTDIARETLMRLAANHLPPTPENFQACYHEIANLPIKKPFPESQLRHLAAALPDKTGEQQRRLADLGIAISRHDWKDVEKALLGFIDGADRNEPAPVQADEKELPQVFSEKLAGFIEGIMPALGEQENRGPKVAEALVQALRQPPVRLFLVEDLLDRTGPQALVSAEEQSQIRASLLALLNLILENIGQLAYEESWLKGQVEGLLAVVGPPLSLRQLDDMERRLREVIEKQGEVRQQSIQAREEMRTMLATFVESLATMNDSSEAFQARIEDSAKKIKKVKKVEELGPLLKEVIGATRAMAAETLQTRTQLKNMQDKVETAEATLARLYAELDAASAQARHDPLTDALNRKGLDDALAREIAGVRRKNQPLSICLLDIDNFKKLNDRLGHEAGDKALVHLANIARQCMRPNDTLARYGGEEFVILMPDTELKNGIEAMVRLQRELTKAFFLAGKEKILITFSAGVAQVEMNESGLEAINRADQAMYLAKRAGKNRVVGG